MKVTVISKKEFENLQPLELGSEVCNSESRVCHFWVNGEHKVLKILNELEGEYFAFKMYTISMLDYYKDYLLPSLHIPDSLAACDGNTIGFTIPFVEGINLATILNSAKFPFHLKIFYLRKIGFILEQLRVMRESTSLKDFYLNDIHESNFVANLATGELGVLDLDSSKIRHNGVYPARYASICSLVQCNSKKYKVNESGVCGGYIIPNNDSEIYCYIMTILNFILAGNFYRVRLTNFYDYLDHLDFFGFDKELLSVFERIILPEPNINPEPYLETLSLKQMKRVRSLF